MTIFVTLGVFAFIKWQRWRNIWGQNWRFPIRGLDLSKMPLPPVSDLADPSQLYIFFMFQSVFWAGMSVEVSIGRVVAD